MLSLQNIIDKFPKEWIHFDEEYKVNKQEILDYYISVGLCKENNPIIEENITRFVGFTQQWLPMNVKESMMTVVKSFPIVAHFDDHADGCTGEDLEKSKAIKNRIVDILKFGQIDGELNPLEKMAVDFLQEIEALCKNRLVLFNLFNSFVINYFESVIPFQQLKELDGNLKLDLYYTLRYHNIGKTVGFLLGVILITKNIDGIMFVDPLWNSFFESIGVISALVNDIFTYDKEVKENGAKINPFHFIQKGRNISKEECLEVFEKELDIWIGKYVIYERTLISKYLSKYQNNKQDLDEFHSLFILSRHLIAGYVTYCKTTQRNKTDNPTFIQLQKTI